MEHWNWNWNWNFKVDYSLNLTEGRVIQMITFEES